MTQRSDPPETYRVAPFGLEAGDSPAATLAQLHAALLPRSPVVLLGPRFMREFYYRVLPEMNLIVGAVAWMGETPAGFIVATHDSDGFMSSAMRRHLPRLGAVLVRSVVGEPSRLAAMWEAFQIMRNRSGPGPQPDRGELLSFGVLPQFRSARFVRSTGVRISGDLMAIALARLQDRGVQQVCSLVDRDNLDVKLMYRGLGWQLTASDVPGWRVPQVEFTWRLEPQTAD